SAPAAFTVENTVTSSVSLTINSVIHITIEETITLPPINKGETSTDPFSWTNHSDTSVVISIRAWYSTGTGQTGPPSGTTHKIENGTNTQPIGTTEVAIGWRQNIPIPTVDTIYWEVYKCETTLSTPGGQYSWTLNWKATG
ncbi:MAG: hypothetical protein QXG14_05200, partial [Candidatus Hadarchaeales archaeon]